MIKIVSIQVYTDFLIIAIVGNSFNYATVFTNRFLYVFLVILTSFVTILNVKSYRHQFQEARTGDASSQQECNYTSN